MYLGQPFTSNLMEPNNKTGKKNPEFCVFPPLGNAGRMPEFLDNGSSYGPVRGRSPNLSVEKEEFLEIVKFLLSFCFIV